MNGRFKTSSDNSLNLKKIRQNLTKLRSAIHLGIHVGLALSVHKPTCLANDQQLRTDYWQNNEQLTSLSTSTSKSFKVLKNAPYDVMETDENGSIYMSRVILYYEVFYLGCI